MKKDLMKIGAFILTVILLGQTVLATNTHSIDLETDDTQYLSAADPAIFGAWAAITIEAWLKPESQPTDAQSMDIANKLPSGGNGFRLVYSSPEGQSGVTRFSMHLGTGGTGEDFGYVITLPTTSWTHMAIQWRAVDKQTRLFINGQLYSSIAGATATGIADNTSAFRIGADQGAPPTVPRFDGRIDDLRIWNYYRTGGEILNDYSRELTGNETGLAVYYKFNQNRNDSTVNGVTLTDNNSTTFQTDIPFLAELPFQEQINPSAF